MKQSDLPRFTPGPWRVEGNEVVADGLTICSMRLAGTFNKNEFLIAAAPALLAACKMLLDDPGLTASANDVLRGAIALAEGRS